MNCGDIEENPGVFEGSKWTFREFNMTELLVVTRPTERSRASEAMFTMNFVFKDCKRKSLFIV